MTSGIYLRNAMQGLFDIQKSINIIYTDKLKKKIHMIISIESRKVCNKIQHPLLIKSQTKSWKQGTKGNFINLVKSIYKKSTSNPYLMMQN